MKAPKKLDHEILFTEVYKILKNRFVLTRELFNKQIQELMEKNYLERNPDMRSISIFLNYIYLMCFFFFLPFPPLQQIKQSIFYMFNYLCMHI